MNTIYQHLAKLPKLQSSSFSTTSSNNVAATVVGASGGIGQPLSMLMKQCALITKLNLHDLKHTLGVTADLHHIDTPAPVKGFVGHEQLEQALNGAEIVILAAGKPRSPGMSRDDLFSSNADIVIEIATAASRVCPKAILCIVTNPINSVIPIAAEVYKRAGNFDPNKLFGVTTLDVLRSKVFIGEIKKIPPGDVDVHSIGGHSPNTMIPLFGSVKQISGLESNKIEALTKRVQNAGTEVVKAKAGQGSATLSTAHATWLLGHSLCRALKGEKNIIQCSYVASKVTEAPYFATPLLLGKKGIDKNLGLPPMNSSEEKQLKIAIEQCKKDADVGISYVQKKLKK